MREHKQTQKMLKIPQTSLHPSAADKKKWIENIRLATYAGFLSSFIQGLNVGDRKAHSEQSLNASRTDDSAGFGRLQLERPHGQMPQDLESRLHHPERICASLQYLRGWYQTD